MGRGVAFPLSDLTMLFQSCLMCLCLWSLFSGSGGLIGIGQFFGETPVEGG